MLNKKDFNPKDQTFILVDNNDCILRYFKPSNPKLLPFIVEKFIIDNKLNPKDLSCYLIIKVSKTVN